MATTTHFSFSSFDGDEDFEADGCTLVRRPPEHESRELFVREGREDRSNFDGETLPVDEASSDPGLLSCGEDVVDKREVVFVANAGCSDGLRVTTGDVCFFDVRRDADVSLLPTDELLVRILDDRRLDFVRFPLVLLELIRLVEAAVEVVLRVERDDLC